MRRCYLSGPMRRTPDHNRAAFLAAELALQAAGWTVYNPARMDMVEPLPVQDDGSPESCRRFARRDTDVILYDLKAEDGDAVVVLPGGDVTRGSHAECALARWVRLDVVSLKCALRPLGHAHDHDCGRAIFGRNR